LLALERLKQVIVSAIAQGLERDLNVVERR